MSDGRIKMKRDRERTVTREDNIALRFPGGDPSRARCQDSSAEGNECHSSELLEPAPSEIIVTQSKQKSLPRDNCFVALFIQYIENTHRTKIVCIITSTIQRVHQGINIRSDPDKL